MTDLTQFNFHGHGVRALTDEHGQPWWIARDVCLILGLDNTAQAVANLDDDEKSNISSSDVGQSGGRDPLIISESGLYALILRSRKPEAREFKRWVTHEVLPAIRKTGGYQVGGRALPRDFSDALRMLAAEVEQTAALTAQIEADAPKVRYVETYVADSDLLTLRTVAANLGVKESELRDLLIERHWIYVEQSSRWSEKTQKVEPQRRYSAYADKKAYFTPRIVHEAPRFKGEAMHTLKVTPAGASAIARLIKGADLAAVTEVAS